MIDWVRYTIKLVVSILVDAILNKTGISNHNKDKDGK